MFAVIADKVAGVKTSEIMLDGEWRIQPSPPKGFEQAPAACPEWKAFDVPGQWLQQGYDVPLYENVGLARRFRVPKAWGGKRIFLRFDAVHGGAHYWLNGKHLGYSQNLFTPVEFDVTEAVCPGGENYLAMVMEVETAAEIASFSSGYAFHNLGGIDRSVRLFALPEIYISDFICDAGLQADYRTGKLGIDLNVVNAADKAVSDVELRLQLFAPDGGEVSLSDADVKLGTLSPGASSFYRSYSVGTVLPWCDEKPHLYRLRIALYGGGKLQEEFEESVGFRSVEVRGSQLLVNGTPVKLAGVCRHEVDPLSGRADTAKWAETDARLLKEANFNYIRTSHYPPTREFLQACDRAGLYIECEGPFCWMHSGRGEREPEAADVLVREFDSMLAYHRNHPSVVIWSLANESGAMPGEKNALPSNFKLLCERCRRMDPTRPVLFNSGYGIDGGECDFAVVHYPPFPVEEFEYVKDDPRPILLDEYFPPQMFIYPDEFVLNPGLEVLEWSTGHNSNDSYWQRMYSSERIAGGAIWTAMNDEFYMPDGTVRGYGDWGFIDGWRRPKSIWWDAKLIHSPFWVPVHEAAWKPGRGGVKIPVHNRHAFTDLGELTIRWELAGRSGECKVSVAPGKTGELEIPVAPDVEAGSLLVLRVFNGHKRLVTAHGITLGEVPAPVCPKAGAGCPEYSSDGDAISIHGDGFDLDISRPAGRMRWSGAVGGLMRFPMLHVARKESRNVFNIDGLGRVEYPDPMKRVVDRVEVEPLPNALRVAFHDHYDLFRGCVEMILDRTGRADVSFRYVYTGEKFSVSELGMRFPMHGDCDEISWQRNSEWDVYPDDHIGRPAGSAKAISDESSAAMAQAPVKPPAWPWHLDMNRFGTRDFRAAKYNITSARLAAADGFGIQVDSDGSRHVRANISRYGIDFHALLNIRPPGIHDPLRGWVYEINKNDEITGNFHVRFLVPAQSK